MMHIFNIQFTMLVNSNENIKKFVVEILQCRINIIFPVWKAQFQVTNIKNFVVCEKKVL